MPNIIEITNIAAPELDPYVRLTEAQLKNRLHPEDGLFIAESPKVIGYALDAGFEPVSLLMERRHIEGKAAALLVGNIPVYTADEALLRELTGYPLTRGVLCAMRRRPLPPVEAVCRNARRVAVLEGIVDTTNIGAIFRSAAALGVDGVLLTPTTCDPLNRRAVRVSMGTVFQVPWTRIAGRRRGSAALPRWASGLWRWRCPTIPWTSTTPACWPSPGWRWCWAPRGTAWPPTPSPAATTPPASPWPTAWIP